MLNSTGILNRNSRWQNVANEAKSEVTRIDDYGFFVYICIQLLSIATCLYNFAKYPSSDHLPVYAGRPS